MIAPEFIKGTLATIILTLLKENGRMYGYEITRAVKEKTSGKILLKEGSLYPALRKLEAEGLVEAQEEQVGKRLRVYYSLTASGKRHTSQKVAELLTFFDTIQSLIVNDQTKPSNDTI